MSKFWKHLLILLVAIGIMRLLNIIDGGTSFALAFISAYLLGIIYDGRDDD